MAIEYRFFDRGDEALIKAAEMPLEGGVAVAVRTTGYEVGTDEVVQMSIVDFDGNELFSQTVKPQNIEEWSDSDAAGGLLPADVTDLPELFQFEDEIIELFENASIVVGQHIGFISEIIESRAVLRFALHGRLSRPARCGCGFGGNRGILRNRWR